MRVVYIDEALEVGVDGVLDEVYRVVGSSAGATRQTRRPCSHAKRQCDSADDRTISRSVARLATAVSARIHHHACPVTGLAFVERP
jgi:hypothetical protein